MADLVIPFTDPIDAVTSNNNIDVLVYDNAVLIDTIESSNITVSGSNLVVSNYSDQLTAGQTYALTVSARDEANNIGPQSGVLNYTAPSSVPFRLVTDAAASQYAEHPDFDWGAANWFIEFDWYGTENTDSNRFYMGSNRVFNVNGFIGIMSDTSPDEVNLRVANNGITDTIDLPVVAGDTLRVQKAGNDLSILNNGVLHETLDITGMISPNVTRIVFGAGQTSNYYSSTDIANLNVNGETWTFSEQSGTQAVGSNGTIITLAPGTGSGNTMCGAQA